MTLLNPLNSGLKDIFNFFWNVFQGIIIIDCHHDILIEYLMDTSKVRMQKIRDFRGEPENVPNKFIIELKDNRLNKEVYLLKE